MDINLAIAFISIRGVRELCDLGIQLPDQFVEALTPENTGIFRPLGRQFGIGFLQEDVDNLPAFLESPHQVIDLHRIVVWPDDCCFDQNRLVAYRLYAAHLEFLARPAIEPVGVGCEREFAEMRYERCLLNGRQAAPVRANRNPRHHWQMVNIEELRAQHIAASAVFQHFGIAHDGKQRFIESPDKGFGLGRLAQRHRRCRERIGTRCGLGHRYAVWYSDCEPECGKAR
jgi:hypothetical protein